ncbi:hypothetical protein ACE198_24635 [Neobacillus sp. KR4-4]|uniref:hypothetical protein n=1 Tax=Neobacillus sp. KR4-4 TaxID=3344872 RepID=UPI0035CA0AAE
MEKQEKSLSDWRMLNVVTGETKEIREGDRLVRGTSAKAYKDLLEKEKQKKKDRKTSRLTQGTFVRVVHNKYREIERELSLPQCSVLLDLFFCVTLKSKNYLVHTSGDKEGEKMNLKDISLYLNKSESNTKKLLGELVKLEALIREKNPKNKKENFYLLNSDFFTAAKGNGQKIKFTKMFHNKLNEVRSKLNDKQYGALLKFIRNFHYQTYYLVANPDHNVLIEPNLSVADNLLLEENEFVLHHLNQTQLAEIIGIKDDTTIKGYVDAYEKAGAFMVHKQHKSYRFIVHPDLMFRKDENGEDEYTKAIRVQFKQLESKKKKAKKRK